MTSTYNPSLAIPRKTQSVGNSGSSDLGKILNLSSAVSPSAITTPPKAAELRSPSDNGKDVFVEATNTPVAEEHAYSNNQGGGSSSGASQVHFSSDEHAGPQGNSGLNGMNGYQSSHRSVGGNNGCNPFINRSPYQYSHHPSPNYQTSPGAVGYSPMSQASSGGGVFNSNGGSPSSATTTTIPPYGVQQQSSPVFCYGGFGGRYGGQAQRYSSGYGSPTLGLGSVGGQKPPVMMHSGAYANNGDPDNRLNLNNPNGNGIGVGGESMKEQGIVSTEHGGESDISVVGSSPIKKNDGGDSPKSDGSNLGGPLAIGGGIPVTGAVRNVYNPHTPPPNFHGINPISLPSMPPLHHGGYRPHYSNIDPALLQQEPWATESLHQAGINPYAFYNLVSDSYLLDRYARFFRSAAENIHPSYMMQGPSRTWSGPLPSRNYKNPMYSCKIFIGGVPWDVSEGALLSGFNEFGHCRVEWPGKEPRYNSSPVKATPRGRGNGYVYMIYEQEKSVRQLLEKCSQEYGCGGDWYFKLNAKRSRTKEIRQVQVIPWVLGDSNYVLSATARLDPKKTVFIGALHGMVTAEILAKIMNDLFDNVVYAGVDTDKFKYPIGSGRVTFSTTESYYAAINAAYVEIKTTKFKKKVQIDPFLEDEICSVCNKVPGPYFCRQMVCFKYFCRVCWQNTHSNLEVFRHHKPLMRNTRRSNDNNESVCEGDDAEDRHENVGGSPGSSAHHRHVRRLINHSPSPNVPGQSNGSNGDDVGHEGDVDTVESQRSFVSNNSASPIQTNSV